MFVGVALGLAEGSGVGVTVGEGVGGAVGVSVAVGLAVLVGVGVGVCVTVGEAVTVGVMVKEQSFSQPSLEIKLPSSQFSGASTFPFPQLLQRLGKDSVNGLKLMRQTAPVSCATKS